MSNPSSRQHEIRHIQHQLESAGHDPYHPPRKLAEPTLCPQCHAVYQHGRWQWLPKPAQAAEHRCPACRRIHDRYPAGFITLSGDYFAAHRDEILHLLRNEQQREAQEHPMARLIDIEQNADETLVTTTDLRLAHRIADAIAQAHGGELEEKFSPDEYRLRIHWSR